MNAHEKRPYYPALYPVLKKLSEAASLPEAHTSKT